MEPRTIVLTVVASLILALTHALDKRLPRFANWPDAARALTAGVLGIGYSTVEAMIKGTSFSVAAWTAAGLTLPSLVVVVVSWFSGAPVDASANKTGPVAILLFIACGAVFGDVAYGCAAAKPACAIIKVANDACEVFDITLPDGSVEKVPADEIKKFGVQHKQFRLAAEKVQRGGQ